MNEDRMRILSVASRLPDHRYSQETITGALLAYWNETLGERSALAFGIVLSPKLPALIKQHLADDLDSFLAHNGLERRGVGSWVIHTGAPKYSKR
jgi:predicted naringenin-chalcone synthase